MIPKKIKKEQHLHPKKDKVSEAQHVPLLPMSLHRQITRKPLSIKEKISNLEKCLKKIKSKESKKSNEANENIKPNHETNESSAKTEATPMEKVKEKRKPGRPGKKKIST